MKKYIALALLLFIFQKRVEIEQWIKPAPDFSQMNASEVVLYSTKNCGYCVKAREFMDENDIPFVDYDINRSNESRNQWLSLGGKGVPVLYVNNNVIHGYNPKKIIEYAGQ